MTGPIVALPCDAKVKPRCPSTVTVDRTEPLVPQITAAGWLVKGVYEYCPDHFDPKDHCR